MKVRQRRPQRIPILAYHALVRGNERELPSGWSRQHAVSRFCFCAQLGFLSDSNRETVALEAFGGAGRRDGKERVAITFDDGHSSDVFAADELERRGFIATFFVPWSLVGCNGYLERGAIVDLARRGFRIGSHGLKHEPLTGKSRSAVEYELSESKTRLEDLTGNEIVDLAVPFGRYNRMVIAAAKSAGFKRVLTSDMGIARAGKSDVLPRLPVSASTTFEEFCTLLSSRPPAIMLERMLRGARRRMARVGESILQKPQQSTS